LALPIWPPWAGRRATSRCRVTRRHANSRNRFFGADGGQAGFAARGLPPAKNRFDIHIVAYTNLRTCAARGEPGAREVLGRGGVKPWPTSLISRWQVRPRAASCNRAGRICGGLASRVNLVCTAAAALNVAKMTADNFAGRAA
jgi:hypothetical protein